LNKHTSRWFHYTDIQGDAGLARHLIREFVVYLLWDPTLSIIFTIKLFLYENKLRFELKIVFRVKNIVSDKQKWINKNILQFMAQNTR
jgi:hypothetical protein